MAWVTSFLPGLPLRRGLGGSSAELRGTVSVEGIGGKESALLAGQPAGEGGDFFADGAGEFSLSRVGRRYVIHSMIKPPFSCPRLRRQKQGRASATIFNICMHLGNQFGNLAFQDFSGRSEHEGFYRGCSCRENRVCDT